MRSKKQIFCILHSALLVMILFLAPSRAGLAKEVPSMQETHAVLLAKVLGPQVDPANYLVSEKFDGVRATWDGKALKFRSGRVVPAPRWFTDSLPLQPLDGELWLGRGRFEELAGFVRRLQPVDAEWRQITFLVFELPEAPGPFSERAQRIREIVAEAKWPQLVTVEQFRVADRSDLQRRLNEVLRAGGEGLMLHLADAPYLTGRSEVLLKLKPLNDTEALVVEHLPGKGKYKGVMGALRLEMPDGKRFVLGTGFTEAVRRNPPAVGAVVTYTFRGLTKKGMPRCASYLRVRDAF